MNTNTAKVVTKLTYYETIKAGDFARVRTRLVLWCGDAIEEILDTDQAADLKPYKRFKKLYSMANERYAAMNSAEPIKLEIDTLAISTPDSQAFIYNTALQISKSISRSKAITRISKVLLAVEWRL